MDPEPVDSSPFGRLIDYDITFTDVSRENTIDSGPVTSSFFRKNN